MFPPHPLAVSPFHQYKVVHGFLSGTRILSFSQSVAYRLLEAQGHPFKTPPFGFRPLSDSCLSMLLFGLDAHLHNEIWWVCGATSPSALPLNTHKRKSTQIIHVSISWLIGSRPAVTTTQLKLVSTNYCQPQVQHLSTNSHTKVRHLSTSSSH